MLCPIDQANYLQILHVDQEHREYIAILRLFSLVSPAITQQEASFYSLFSCPSIHRERVGLRRQMHTEQLTCFGVTRTQPHLISAFAELCAPE